MRFNVCIGGLLLYGNVLVWKKETLSPRLRGENGIKWKRIKRIILEYSSFALFGSFNGGEFWQIHHWITFSSYNLHVCKISKKLKINSYIINNLFKLQVFVI